MPSLYYPFANNTIKHLLSHWIWWAHNIQCFKYPNYIFLHFTFQSCFSVVILSFFYNIVTDYYFFSRMLQFNSSDFVWRDNLQIVKKIFGDRSCQAQILSTVLSLWIFRYTSITDKILSVAVEALLPIYELMQCGKCILLWGHCQYFLLLRRRLLLSVHFKKCPKKLRQTNLKLVCMTRTYTLHVLLLR